MYRSEDEVRAALAEGRLLPSNIPRDFTIELGPASRHPRVSDIWLLVRAPHDVSEISVPGSTVRGELRSLTARLPGPPPNGN
jgi:hypothetical protein